MYGLFYTGFIASYVLAQIEAFVLWLRREDYKKYGLDLQTEELVCHSRMLCIHVWILCTYYETVIILNKGVVCAYQQRVLSNLSTEIKYCDIIFFSFNKNSLVHGHCVQLYYIDARRDFQLMQELHTLAVNYKHLLELRPVPQYSSQPAHKQQEEKKDP